MNKHIERTSSGLVCDNPACDYENREVTEANLKDWVNAPCPKCGENLLTEDDFDRAINALEVVELINSLSEEQLIALASKMGLEVDLSTKEEATVKTIIRVNTHKELSFEVKHVPNDDTTD